MDAFEQVVSEILWAKGYWTRRSFKVSLTKGEKIGIGKPTTPRWGIDVVAYRPKDNELLAVECKSYLDSRGVTLSSFDGSNPKLAKRYKLFCDEKVNKVVPGALRRELSKLGLCSEMGATKLCLVCGRIARRTRPRGARATLRQEQLGTHGQEMAARRLRVHEEGGLRERSLSGGGEAAAGNGLTLGDVRT